MSEKTTPWKRRAAYAAFASFALVFGLFVTFPYDTLEELIRLEAASAGYEVKMGSLGPGFFGVRATDVKVSKTIPAGVEGVAEPLMIDSLSIRPALFPLGVSLSANLMGGDLDATFGGLGDLTVKVDADELDPSKGNFKAFSGVDLTGLISANVSMSIPKNQLPGQKVKQPDLGAASGTISLEGTQLAVNGGTVTVPIMGEPTPMDLPKILFGRLDGRMVFEKGSGTLELFDVKGDDIEIHGSGTMKLARNIDFSEVGLKVRLKAEDAFVKRLGLIGSGLSMLPADPKEPAFRTASINGFLNRPQFVPGGR